MTPLLPFLLLSVIGAVLPAVCFHVSGLRLLWLLPLEFIGAFVLLLLIYLLFLAVVTLPVDPKRQRTEPSSFYFGIYEYTLGLACALCRIRIRMEGTELLPETPFLLVQNHRSNFDPIVTGWALRGRHLAFVSKPQNFKIPIAGSLARACCYLPINRENDREALKTILASADYLKRGAGSIGVYPEGTRNRQGTDLLPFRPGAFKIAQKADVPIVICALLGTEKISRRTPWRATEVTLKFCRTISAEEAKSLKTMEIGELAESCMLAEIKELR